MRPILFLPGEMAQLEAEGEYEALMEAEPNEIFPFLDDFYTEQERRSKLFNRHLSQRANGNSRKRAKSR